MMIRKALIVLFLLVAVSSGFAGEVIRLTSGEWPPYTSKTLPGGGLAGTIVAEAFALKNIRIDYGWFPWQRAFDYARRGKWDGSFVWFKTPDREKEFYFSETVLTGEMVFFYLKKKQFDWQTIDDLKTLRVGATIGYGDYGREFMDAEKKGRIAVQRVPSDLQNFKKLLLGRIDVFPLPLRVGNKILKESFKPGESQQITYHPKRIQINNYSLILPRNVERSKYYLKTFNEGLAQLKESGRYDDLIDSYDQP